MALNSRQLLLYTDRFDLYKPSDVVHSIDLSVDDRAYPSSPTYANVSGYKESTPNVDVPAMEGRDKVANIFTEDKFHFEATQPVGANWLIKMKTATHPETGQWWMLQGDPQISPSHGNRRANKLMVYGVRTAPPTGLT